MDNMKCPLCGAEAALRYPDHPGFMQPRVYAIYSCANCKTSFADPLEADQKIYELIYADPSRVPGYDRYEKNAEAVKGAADPLGCLAAREDMYWAVKRYLSERPPAKGAKLLEVGSGLGYLTYSLHKMGLDITGLDISEKAVRRAEARYGPHYECGDLKRFGEGSGGRYDVVIMTELIEHLPDVMETLEAAAGLLGPGGELLVTTPNKSSYPDETLWETDAPPVHLWWFSEDSMEYIAGRLGLAVRFIDFTEYNKTHFQNVWRRGDPSRPSKAPVFRPDGSIVPGASPTEAYRALKRCLWTARDLRTRLVTTLAGAGNVPSRRGTMAAVFTKK